MAEASGTALPGELDADDAKLITLARSAMARTGAEQGAAVRDTDGRTYSGSTVALPALRLSALQAAVAAAVSSGIDGVEAAAVVSAAGASSEVDEASVAAVRDLSADAVVLLADASGSVVDVRR